MCIPAEGQRCPCRVRAVPLVPEAMPPHCLVPEALPSSDDACIRSLLATFHERRGVDMLSGVKARSSSPAQGAGTGAGVDMLSSVKARSSSPAKSAGSGDEVPAAREQNRPMDSGSGGSQAEPADGFWFRRFASRTGRWDELIPRPSEYRERKRSCGGTCFPRGVLTPRGTRKKIVTMRSGRARDGHCGWGIFTTPKTAAEPRWPGCRGLRLLGRHA